MIERGTAASLKGQLEMKDMLPAAAREGYDAGGRLINPWAEAEAGEGGLSLEQADRLRTLASEVNAITEQARVVLASAALEIGKRLIEAKGLVPRGRFKEWLDNNVNYSERKAQQLMQLYEEYGRAPAAYAGLGISQMTALLAAPEDQREALARRATEEGLSVRQLQAEIDRLRKENDGQLMIIEGLNEQIDDAQTLLDNYKATNEAIEREREAARHADARAKAAEASADELRRLHSDAEDRAAASAQRASDAVERANRTAKELSEARASIARLEAEAAAREAEVKTVEVVPDALTRELEALREKVAALEAGQAKPAEAHDAVARFRLSFERLTAEFKAAEALLADVTKEDAKAGSMYASALVKACHMMIDRLGVET